MGMSLGSNGRHQANINMTPMIDVLLVLIIIFMVITPTTSRGLNALLPQPDSGAAPATPSGDIVVTVNRDHTVSINQETVPLEELAARLQRLYINHPGHPLFVRGGDDLEFEQVAVVIDIARGVGLDHIALMTVGKASSRYAGYGDESDTLARATVSAVVRPDGTLLIYQPYGQEGVLIADIDIDAATGLFAARREIRLATVLFSLRSGTLESLVASVVSEK